MNIFLGTPLQFSLPSVQRADFLSSARALEQKTLRVVIPIFQSISEATYRIAIVFARHVVAAELISFGLLIGLVIFRQFECLAAQAEFIGNSLFPRCEGILMVSAVAASIFFTTSWMSFGAECVLYKYALERVAGRQLEELDQSLLQTLLNWRGGDGVRLLILRRRSLEVFREMRNSFGNRLPQDVLNRLDELLWLEDLGFEDLRFGAEVFFPARVQEQVIGKRPIDLHVKASTLDLDYTPASAFAYRTEENSVSASFVSETFVENTRNRACTYSSFSRTIEGVSIGDATFTSLFRQMEEKHRDLLNNESAVAAEIERNFPYSYETLKRNLCNDDVSQMLQRGEEGQTVAPEYLQLHSILRYIFSLSDQVESTAQRGFFSFFFLWSRPLNLLSPREEVLLALASSVQGCVPGKKTSIAAFYNQLPLEFKRPEAAQASERIQGLRMEEFVYQTLIGEVASQFDSFSPFVQERLGTNLCPRELVHQTLFLKNFIGARVGLPVGIQEDRHEMVASPNLYGGDINAAFENPEPLVRATLDSFYRSFTPSRAIAAIKRKLVGQEHLLAPINDLIEEYLQRKNPRDEKYLVRVEVGEDEHLIDQNTNQVVCEICYSSAEGRDTAKITDYGAFLLLKALGYLA